MIERSVKKMDMENVIKGLELCSDALYCADPNSRCSQCPYRTKDMTGTDERNCSDILMADALELLKEQEAVVRCKDCKYYDHFNGCMSWHDVNSSNDNWYCADGERREGR